MVVRRVVVVALVVGACSSPEPVKTEPVVKADPVKTEPVKTEPVKPAEPAAPAEVAEEEEDEEEPSPAVAFDEASAPVAVLLGGRRAHTKKPARNVVLGHSWGWDTATAATIRRCEQENAGQVGKLMWCSTEDKPEGSEALIERRKIYVGKSVFVAPEDVAGWGIPTPTSPVWLIGGDRVCAAAVGRPIVGYYSIDADGGDPDFSDHFAVLELAWELTGCDKATAAWAPIGVVAASLDSSLRWVPAKAGPRERLDPATWTGALAAAVKQLPGEAAAYVEAEALEVSGAPEWWHQTRELPGSGLRETFFGAAWRGPEGSSAPGKYRCGDSEYGAVIQHRGEVQLGRGSHGALVGGLVGGGASYLVWSGEDAYSAARVEADRLGPVVTVSTGTSHPESGGTSGYSLIGYCGP